MDYKKRLIDLQLDMGSKAFSAINIIGPKGCGKTRTATERSKSVVSFHNPANGKQYIAMAKDDPVLLLKGVRPILFDEWQDAPEIWDAIRWECDNGASFGDFYLTGSTGKMVKTKHTGTGRISTLRMLTMSCFEYGESNGSVSLSSLFNDPSYEVRGQTPVSSSLEDFMYSACRGGWPRSLEVKDKRGKLLIAKDYFNEICYHDVSAYDGVVRNESWARAILQSYARNIATPAKDSVLYLDVNSNYPMSSKTFENYVEVLKKLFILDEIDAWTPNIRSKKAIRSGKKKIFLDPSIATSALDISPEYFLQDYDLFGHVFENLVLRDLLVYAGALNGHLRHYRDEQNLEADAVLELQNGKYALIEIKTGSSRIEEAEENLLKLANLIKKYNASNPSVAYREPEFLAVIVGNLPIAYTSKNGVKIIPFGALGI